MRRSLAERGQGGRAAILQETRVSVSNGCGCFPVGVIGPLRSLEGCKDIGTGEGIGGFLRQNEKPAVVPHCAVVAPAESQSSGNVHACSYRHNWGTSCCKQVDLDADQWYRWCRDRSPKA